MAGPPPPGPPRPFPLPPLPPPPAPPPPPPYAMSKEWSFLSFEVVLVAGTVLLLMRHLADKSVLLSVKVVVCLSWFVSVFLFTLVPLDVAVTVAAEGPAPTSLKVLYQLPYILTQLLTWLLLPFYQGYADAGDFTSRARMRRSVRENATFYAVLIGVGLLSLIGLVVVEGKNFHLNSLMSTGIAFSLSFSIATGMLLMGYGLSEIPRICWLRSVLTTRQRWCEHGVGKISDQLTQAHTELGKVVWSADQMSTTMPRRHALRWAMDVIDECVRKVAVAGVSPENEEGDDEEYDYEDINALANLRCRLNRALIAFERVKYEYMQAVTVAIEVSDIVDCRLAGRSGGGDQKFRSSLRPPRTGPNAALKDRLEYQWKCVARRYLMRTLAVVLALTSVILILAEITIWLQLTKIKADKVNDFSLISLMISKENKNDIGTMLIVSLVLFYMLASTYFTVLKLAMFSFFKVVPGHTDAVSLIISATLFSRYASPLCINFLSMMPLVHQFAPRYESVFETALGIHMRGTEGGGGLPPAAVWFIDIFPIVLGIFCPLVTLGLLDRLKSCFSKFKFSVSEEGICDETTAKGRAILEREKASIRIGGRPGESHSAFAVREKEPKKRAGLGGYFAGRKSEAGPADDEGPSGREEQRSLLAPERERAPTRGEEIKARLGARLEAIGQTSAVVGRPPPGREPAPRPASSGGDWRTGGGASAAAAQPRGGAGAAAPAAKPGGAVNKPAASASSSLDSFFASL